MIGSLVHQCPKCELRFSFRTELEHHLREDHPLPATAERPSPATVDEAHARITLATPTPAQTSAKTVQRRAPWPRARLAGLLFAVAALLVVAYAALFVSIASALAVAAALLVVSVIYLRRTRGRARVPRR
jgi:Flp pilus assembly protein TadB